jgi:hypothetical protein
VIGVFTNQVLNVVGLTVQVGLASVGSNVNGLRGGDVGPQPMNAATPSPARAICIAR